MVHQPPRGPRAVMGVLTSALVVLALILLAAWVVESEAVGATAREQQLQRQLQTVTANRNQWRRAALAFRRERDRCLIDGQRDYEPVPTDRPVQ